MTFVYTGIYRFIFSFWGSYFIKRKKHCENDTKSVWLEHFQFQKPDHVAQNCIYTYKFLNISEYFLSRSLSKFPWLLQTVCVTREEQLRTITDQLNVSQDFYGGSSRGKHFMGIKTALKVFIFAKFSTFFFLIKQVILLVFLIDHIMWNSFFFTTFFTMKLVWNY